MGSTLSLTHLRGLTSGSNANEILIDSGHTMIASNGGQIIVPGQVIQTVYIKDATSQATNGSEVTITSCNKSITALRDNSDFIYHAAIPSEHDTVTATNQFFFLERQIAGGGYSYVPDSMTNGQAPGHNGTSLNSVTFIDDTLSVTAGQQVDYRVRAKSGTTGTNLQHWNQPTLGGQPSEDTTNHTLGYIMEIAR